MKITRHYFDLRSFKSVGLLYLLTFMVSVLLFLLICLLIDWSVNVIPLMVNGISEPYDGVKIVMYVILFLYSLITVKSFFKGYKETSLVMKTSVVHQFHDGSSSYKKRVFANIDSYNHSDIVDLVGSMDFNTMSIVIVPRNHTEDYAKELSYLSDDKKYVELMMKLIMETKYLVEIRFKDIEHYTFWCLQHGNIKTQETKNG